MVTPFNKTVVGRPPKRHPPPGHTHNYALVSQPVHISTWHCVSQPGCCCSLPGYLHCSYARRAACRARRRDTRAFDPSSSSRSYCWSPWSSAWRPAGPPFISGRARVCCVISEQRTHGLCTMVMTPPSPPPPAIPALPTGYLLCFYSPLLSLSHSHF